MDPVSTLLGVLFAVLLVGSAAVGSAAVTSRRRPTPRPASVGEPVPVAPPALIGAEELARLRGELASAMADLSSIRTEWRAHQKTLDSYLEAFEDLEETVERKRRRVAAREGYEKRRDAGQQEEVSDPRAAARLRARALGFKV